MSDSLREPLRSEAAIKNSYNGGAVRCLKT